MAFVFAYYYVFLVLAAVNTVEARVPNDLL